MTDRPVINIGWARAGSTAFRRNFLERHPDVLAAGRTQSLADGPAAVILPHVKMDGDAEFAGFVPELRAEWKAYAERNPGRVLCLTDEELSIGLPGTGVSPATIAARCMDILPRARTLAIVRDPVDAVRSFYALAQREGRTGGLSYAGWSRRFISAPSEGESFAYLFAYMTTLGAYLQRQTKADVLVVPWERLASDPRPVYAEIARWLGISERPCEHLPTDVVNASPRPQADGWDAHRRATEAEADADVRAAFAHECDALAQTFGIDYRSARVGRAV
jgi:Sulfotransferase family